MLKHSIIIIREHGEMVASCCIPLDGGFVQELTGTDPFASCHEQIQSTAELYRILCKEVGKDAEIIIVDARNFAYIFPKLIKDCIRFRVSMRNAIKTLFLYQIPSVIVDGYLLSSGKKKFTEQTIKKIQSYVS